MLKKSEIEKSFFFVSVSGRRMCMSVSVLSKCCLTIMVNVREASYFWLFIATQHSVVKYSNFAVNTTKINLFIVHRIRIASIYYYFIG